jgi:hypothetical protein
MTYYTAVSADVWQAANHRSKRRFTERFFELQIFTDNAMHDTIFSDRTKFSPIVFPHNQFDIVSFNHRYFWKFILNNEINS